MIAADKASAVTQRIFEAISEGAFVMDACKAAGITRKTLHQWCQNDKNLGDAYARAREQQAHALAEKALQIADGTDTLTEEREQAIEEATEALTVEQPKHWRKIVHALESNLIQRDRLRVDALKWMTSKIAPRLYGERAAVEVTGKDGEPIGLPVVVWSFGKDKDGNPRDIKFPPAAARN